MFKKLIQKITEWWRNRKRRGVGGHEYVVVGVGAVPNCSKCKFFCHDWIPCDDCNGKYATYRSYFMPKEAARPC